MQKRPLRQGRPFFVSNGLDEDSHRSHDTNMTGVREAKKQAVREALYDAALSLFRSKGYELTTAAEIAAAAGVAKGTLFNHFPTKADIIAAWYRRELIPRLSEPGAMPGNAPPSQALSALTLRILDLSRNDPELWQAQIREAPSSPAIQDAERAAEAGIRESAAGLIKAAGKVPAEAVELADLYVSLVTGTVREWVVTGQGFDLDRRLSERTERLCKLAGVS